MFSKMVSIARSAARRCRWQCTARCHRYHRVLRGGARSRSLVPFGTVHTALFAHLSQRNVTVDRLELAALEVVVPAVEDLAELGDLVQVADQRVFNQVVCVATSLLGKLVELGLRLWCEVDLHVVGHRATDESCQA